MLLQLFEDGYDFYEYKKDYRLFRLLLSFVIAFFLAERYFRANLRLQHFHTAS